MIRAAALADVDAIAALEDECFGAAAWSGKLIAAEISHDTRRVLIAHDGIAAVGYGSIMVVGDVADLQRIAVCLRSRRHGQGHRLLDALSAIAADEGATRMLLEVSAVNAAAIALYESFGFARIAVRKHYYADGTDAAVMERILAGD